ncbi:MAG: NAD(P)-binding protein [Marmoricola sp.]
MLNLIRKAIRDDRALSQDAPERHAYRSRINDQAANSSTPQKRVKLMPKADKIHDAIIIGAGFGGMGAAIQLRRSGYDDLVIIDRENDLGGTWHVNHYPGLAVDIPSSTHSYSFEPNPDWSRPSHPARS